MDLSNDSDSDDECHHPTVSISMEYIEKDETFNIYIRRISNCPYLISYRKKMSRAVLYVVCGIHKNSWMGRPRQITKEEIETHNTTVFRTLAVERESTTIFNEFFTCTVSKELFRQTLLRIQFCDVNHMNDEILISECDYWINNRPIPTFHDFILPLTMTSPDLGEVELTLAYLPTAQRLNIEKIKVTNLKKDDNIKAVRLKAYLYNNNQLYDTYQTEDKSSPYIDNQHGFHFKRFFFSIHSYNVSNCILVIQVIQLQEHSKVIGQFGLSDVSSGCDHVVWKKILTSPCKRITEVFRLRPGT